MGKSSSIEEHHTGNVYFVLYVLEKIIISLNIILDDHDHHDDDEDEEFSEGLTGRQKSAIGFIWYLKIFFPI